MSTNENSTNVVAAASTDDGDAITSGPTDAFRVRQNLLRSIWSGYTRLGRAKQIFLTIRLFLSLAQVAAFIPVLSLNSSRGNSYLPRSQSVCNPQPIFIYLLIHVIRLSLNIPCELYLGLSPHRTASARRSSPQTRAARERDRAWGSIPWDRRIGKISDALGFAAIVLFLVGNYVVFSSTECSKKPADSIALFWSGTVSLIITYLVILEIVVLAFLVVCALPLLIIILRALGLGHRIPTNQIKPETGKIDQKEVDKRVRLVYYTPAEEPKEEEQQQQQESLHLQPSSQEGHQSQNEAQTNHDDQVQTGLTSSTIVVASTAQGIVEEPSTCLSKVTSHTSPSNAADSTATTTATATSATTLPPATQPTSTSSLGRLTRLFFPRSRSSSTHPNVSPSNQQPKPPALPISNPSSHPQPCTDSPTTTIESSNPHRSALSSLPSTSFSSSTSQSKLKYPLYPIPAHRATCPICLCDFEPPNLTLDPDPEPLRLLDCGHVLHKSCVDEWFTTVSARCPVCQKPLIQDDDDDDDDEESSPQNDIELQPTTTAH